MKLPQEFKEFFQLLHSKGVEYLLVGGYAVGYYGFPRTTGDMDIWVATNPDNAVKVIQALRQFGFDFHDVSPETLQKKDGVLRMGVPPMRIEILTSIDGVDFKDCYQARNVDVIDGVEVNVIGLEDLKRNKKTVGRHKDLNDLENLP